MTMSSMFYDLVELKKLISPKVNTTNGKGSSMISLSPEKKQQQERFLETLISQGDSIKATSKEFGGG